MTLHIEPDNKHPLPKTFSDEVADSFHDNARVAASTAMLMSELGMPFEMTEEDERKARELFQNVDSRKKSKKDTSTSVTHPDLYSAPVAARLSALLNEYDKTIIADAAQARTYIMNRLLDISACGDTKNELRAIELLGKMSDISAFTEKSEITITHRTSEDLRKAISDKISKLLGKDNAVDVEVKTITDELDELDRPEVADADEPARTE